MIRNIRKEDFDSIFFEAEIISPRVSTKELSHFIDNENALRDMISRKKLLYQNEKNVSSLAAYEQLEDECQINVDTMPGNPVMIRLSKPRRYKSMKPIIFARVADMKYYRGITQHEYTERMIHSIETYQGENWMDKEVHQ